MIQVSYDQAFLADFCRCYHVRTLSFFGSVVRNYFTKESYIDILVEFKSGKTPGFAFFDME